MKKQMITSESFSGGKQTYFLDFKRADNNSKYLQITRSEQQKDGSFKRWSFIVFENHLELFISAFSSVFQNLAYPDPKYRTVRELKEEALVKGIRAMDEDQRPREKLMGKGAGSLSNAELLALLIGSGKQDLSAVDLAERILDRAGGLLDGLKSMSISRLCSLGGMGVAKSCAVLAAMELGKRLYEGTEPGIGQRDLKHNADDDPDEHLKTGS